MRKKYPYLEETYVPDLNVEQQKRHFLARIDDFINQRQYVNITLLDWHENPIKEIDGIIASGTITKDGNSSVRRTCSLSCSVNGESYNVDDLNLDFSLNKKVFIEIGIKNETGEYPDWSILWFPQGVFYINSFSMNSSTTSAVNLTLQLKDKMSLLNGDVGGKLPATVQFDTMTTQLADGTITEQKVLYYNIIRELVHHWGEEDLNNIIIQDVPLRIRRIMQWNGVNPIYLQEVTGTESNTEGYQVFLEEPSTPGWKKYEQGDDVGYVFDDFVPVSELTGAAGDTVCTVLDTIKNQLGNYEYFYDVFGIFHFREIRNFLNITQSNIILQETGNPGRHVDLQQGQFQLDSGSEIQYLVETTNEKTLYSFSDAHNITSITVTPNYDNIKNDYIVDGIRKSPNSDIQYSLRYRVVIDEKPEIVTWINKNSIGGNAPYSTVVDVTDLATPKVGAYGEFNDILYYTYPEVYNGQIVLETNKLGKWFDYYNADISENPILPDVGNMDQIYRTIENGSNVFWLWTGTGYQRLYLKEDLNNPEAEEKSPVQYDYYYPIDWRTFLYLYGLEANSNGTDPGPYFSDLDAFWPNEYDLRRDQQKFFGQEEDESIHYKTLTSGNFFFDIIDASSSSLGMYSVQNIGRRVDVYNNNDVNCLFQPLIPDVVFLNKDNPTVNWSENTTITELRKMSDIKELLQAQRQECIDNNQPWAQVSDNIYANFITGGYLNGAYDAIKYELFLHTKFQRVVSLTALPNFYLEPNSRVEVSERTTNTYGDFMIQTINLTLGPGANMSVTLNEVSERL